MGLGCGVRRGRGHPAGGIQEGHGRRGAGVQLTVRLHEELQGRVRAGRTGSAAAAARAAAPSGGPPFRPGPRRRPRRGRPTPCGWPALRGTTQKTPPRTHTGSRTRGYVVAGVWAALVIVAGASPLPCAATPRASGSSSILANLQERDNEPTPPACDHTVESVPGHRVPCASVFPRSVDAGEPLRLRPVGAVLLQAVQPGEHQRDLVGSVEVAIAVIPVFDGCPLLTGEIGEGLYPVAQGAGAGPGDNALAVNARVRVTDL